MKIAVVLLLAGCAAPRAIWIGGDVHLGVDGAERLRPVSDAMAGAVGIVNLEGPIGTQAQARDSSAALLVNGPQTPAALSAAGIVAAGIVNNHSADLGDSAATRKALEAAGLRDVLTLRGLKLVLTAHDLTAGVPANLSQDLTAARARGDVLIATFHVTGPPLLLPRRELLEAVDLALTAGATVIAAHGTHALANVERRGDAVIAWGLGNLVFACTCTDEPDGLVLRVEFDARGKIVTAAAIPIDAGLHGSNASLAKDPKLQLDVLESLGAKPVRRLEDRLEL